jgi:hypothetical protein
MFVVIFRAKVRGTDSEYAEVAAHISREYRVTP